MSQIAELEQKGIVKALGVKQDELFEAKINLLGFFDVLYRIDKRLKEENIMKKSIINPDQKIQELKQRQ